MLITMVILFGIVYLWLLFLTVSLACKRLRSNESINIAVDSKKGYVFMADDEKTNVLKYDSDGMLVLIDRLWP